MYSSTYEGHPLNGCLFEGAQPSGPQLGASGQSISQLPGMVDLSPYCTPVENQGQTNSCVANAIVGAVELLQKKAGAGAPDLSRLFLYFNARAIGNREHMDEGTFIHHGMAAMLAHGVCEERMWPFQKSAVNSSPTQGCYQNASHYEAIQFARTPGSSALEAIAMELPVAFGIVLPNECYQVASKTGVIPPPEILPVQSPPSGHAMLIVGYDMSEKLFIVRNSWGPQFGRDGYILIPFDVMERYAHPDQFYTIGAIERAPGLKIFGESVADSVAALASTVASLPTPDLSRLRSNVRSDLDGRLDKAKKGFASRLRGGS